MVPKPTTNIVKKKITVYGGGCYMKTIAEHTECSLGCEVLTDTPFSVTVHCHQWRERLWEDRKRPPDRPAFDFLGKGTHHLLRVLWLEVSAE